MSRFLSAHRLVPVVSVTVAIQTLLTLSSTVPVAIAPELTRSLDLPAASIGYFVSLIYGGAMTASVFGGTFNRRFGPVRVSQWALMLAAVGSLSVASAQVLAVMIGTFIIGLGYGLTNPAASELLSRVVTAHNRNIVFSLKQSGVPLGAVLAGLTAPAIAVYSGWQGALFAVTLVLMLAALLLQSIRPDWDMDIDNTVRLHKNPFREMTFIWSNPALKYLALASFFYSAIQMSLGAFTVTMLVDDIQFGLIEAGFVLSLVQASGAFGRIVWGRIADKIHDGNGVLMALAVVSAVASLLTASLDTETSKTVIYGVFILFGLSSIGWNGVYLAEVARLVPAGKIAAATGAALFVTFAGVLVGPSLFSLVHRIFDSFDAVFAIMALLPAAGFVCAFLARCHKSSA